MAKLIYTAFTSLDGYTEDAEGRFDWAVPDAHRLSLGTRGRASLTEAVRAKA
jgi:hypothetical protein